MLIGNTLQPLNSKCFYILYLKIIIKSCSVAYVNYSYKQITEHKPLKPENVKINWISVFFLCSLCFIFENMFSKNSEREESTLFTHMWKIMASTYGFWTL